MWLLKRLDLPAVILRASDIPGVHVVPAAIAIGVDQTPEAQRWNEEPLARQNHAPSFVQAPDCVPEDVVLPLESGTPADETDDAATGTELTGIGETKAVDVAVASGAADVAPVAKTPAEVVVGTPGAKPGAEDAVKGLEPNGADVVAGVEPAEGVPAVTAAAEPHPAGTAFRLTPMVPFTTDAPGSGYRESSPSTVMHPLLTPARLATNIAGKVLWRLETLGSGA
jgi:hypothetical protein